MTPDSVTRIDGWWRTVMDVDPAQLWASVTISPHSHLGDYPGLYVAWRGDGVHVSAPASEVESLESQAALEIADLQHADHWSRVAAARGWQVIGPATHTYLDTDPGMPTQVEVATIDQLGSLRVAVTEAEWAESGWADGPPLVWVVRDGDEVLAAANLNPWGDKLGDLGVLVAPAQRGRGLAALVGAAAASYAVRDSGIVRWCARTSNVASLGAARRVGFEPWLTQLAVRP